jgi:hypothetical protein
MPLGKRSIILSICALGVALFFFETRVAEAQSCPVPPTCGCGNAVCDDDGNCTCSEEPTCECVDATCNSSGQWECDEDMPDCDDEHCWAPACEDDGWECVYDPSGCEDAVGRTGPLAVPVVPVI